MVKSPWRWRCLSVYTGENNSGPSFMQRLGLMSSAPGNSNGLQGMGDGSVQLSCHQDDPFNKTEQGLLTSWM